MKNIILIVDRYISPKILPGEHSSCWIKWKKGVVFDKIVLRYEADVEVFRLFNIDEDAFKDDYTDKGKIIIPKHMIQIDGFFGFSSYYAQIPSGERKISYKIDIVSGTDVQTISFENTITRPMIKVLKATPDNINISEYSPQPEQFYMNAKSVGTAGLHDLSYFIDFTTTDKLTVEISTIESKSKEIALKSEQRTAQNISIKGKGSGLIRIGVTYKDANNTKYEDILKEIPTVVKCEGTQTIPISEQIEKHGSELLTVLN